MPFEKFDRSRLKLKPLSERVHDLHLETTLLELDAEIPEMPHPALDTLAARIQEAKQRQSTVLWMIGAHVLRAGTGRFLIELMKNGYITHLALNGAGAIHDYEFALIGATTESVAKYIRTGEFGLWNETGRINDIAKEAANEGLGLGEAIGRAMDREQFPFRETSVLYQAYRLQVPATIHVGIGCDIIHEHPNCSGAALGESSYTDFLIYTHSISRLQGGVFCNFGSGVIGPEVYLKAISMSRNVALQQGENITKFTTAVFDLLPLEGKDVHETPPKSDPRYYFRPWKTILSRTVADGGESFYVQGEHKLTVPNLARKILVSGERR